MTKQPRLPILVTFDGQARSGKGTIVHAVKRALQTEGVMTMLIDAGQVFRVLVVSAQQHGVDLDSPDSIETFLSDQKMLHATVGLIKKVYAMEHVERDKLLYTPEVSVNSAKIGAHAKSQLFKDGLLKKWLRDAATEGYEVVLLDGRALEEVGGMLEREKLCTYSYGLYFICDPFISARRTLGFADKSYDALFEDEQAQVMAMVDQINARNKSDAERQVQPIMPPKDATVCVLPDFSFNHSLSGRLMVIVDTSIEQDREAMTTPVVEYFVNVFTKNT